MKQIALFLLAYTCAGQAQEFVPEERHKTLITVDTHIDIPVSLATYSADPGIYGPMQVDIPKMHEGGLDIGFFIVYVAQASVTAVEYELAYQRAQLKFAGIERMLARYPDQIGLARNPDEAHQLLADGKLVAAIGIENAFPIGPNLEHLQEFYDRGARYISLTHFGHNDFASSSSSRGGAEDYIEPEHDGLSEKGRELIRRMNELGIMVDVSHTSAESTVQAAEYSRAPVIASHSGVKTLYDHSRNMTDEEIIAVAEGGGVIQLVAFDTYMRDVSEANREEMNKIRDELDFEFSSASQELLYEYRLRLAELGAQYPRANIGTLVDHIDYVVELVGVDHAGISSDFGGGGGVEGWDHIGQSAAVTEELFSRGYTHEEVEKIWGRNLLRVWAEVEALAD